MEISGAKEVPGFWEILKYLKSHGNPAHTLFPPKSENRSFPPLEKPLFLMGLKGLDNSGKKRQKGLGGIFLFLKRQSTGFFLEIEIMFFFTLGKEIFFYGVRKRVRVWS